jgi:hypothetical protein
MTADRTCAGEDRDLGGFEIGLRGESLAGRWTMTW